MNEGIFTDPHITTRISNWQQSVYPHAKQHVCEGRQALLVTTGYGPNCIQLRPSVRACLNETSGNQRRTGRKRSIAEMMGPQSNKNTEGNDGKSKRNTGGKRGPGRPRKSPQPSSEVTPGFIELGPKDSVSVIIPGSPSKKVHSVPSAELDKPDEKITLQDLNQCTPAVFPTNMRDLKTVLEYPVPETVERLYNKLRGDFHAVIPGELQTHYREKFETPTKSTYETIDGAQFLPHSTSRFPGHLLSTLDSTVQKVFKKAKRNQKKQAIERQWGATALFLLDAAESLFPSLEVLNIENCSIQPYQMRPTRAGTQTKFVDLGDGQTQISRDTASQVESFARMVDWTVALEIDALEERTLEIAYSSLADNERSVGQNSTNYLRNSPLAFDIEVKKENDPRNPLVQLAVWVCAGFKKKKSLGLKKLDMPMPGLLIKGHAWEWCIFFNVGGNLALLGPYPMGTTATIAGIWTILTRLAILMEWAHTDFRKWFKDDVLGWAKEAKKKLIAEGRVPTDDWVLGAAIPSTSE